MAFKHAYGDTAEAGQWEVAGRIIRETGKAIQLDDGVSQQWLPRSKITIRAADKHGLVEVLMPEWLAKEKKYT